MTTSRKIYLLVLVLAIGVLIWDKAINAPSASSPASAQAIHASPPPVSPPTIPDPGTAEQMISTPDIRTLQSLRDLSLSSVNSSDNFSSPQRDIFQISSAFQKKLLESRKQNPRFREALPAPMPQLKAILIADRNQYALLDDEILGPGQTIGPYRLLQVRKNSVLLSGPQDRKFRLSIEDSNTAASERPEK